MKCEDFKQQYRVENVMKLYHSGIHVHVRNVKYHVRFEALMTTAMKITAFQNKMLYILAHIYFHAEDGSSRFLYHMTVNIYQNKQCHIEEDRNLQCLGDKKGTVLLLKLRKVEEL
jgi:hypothetical protein